MLITLLFAWLTGSIGFVVGCIWASRSPERADAPTPPTEVLPGTPAYDRLSQRTHDRIAVERLLGSL